MIVRGRDTFIILVKFSKFIETFKRLYVRDNVNNDPIKRIILLHVWHNGAYSRLQLVSKFLDDWPSQACWHFLLTLLCWVEYQKPALLQNESVMSWCWRNQDWQNFTVHFPMLMQCYLFKNFVQFSYSIRLWAHYP